jgi:hypothetical protein
MEGGRVAFYRIIHGSASLFYFHQSAPTSVGIWSNKVFKRCRLVRDTWGACCHAYLVSSLLTLELKLELCGVASFLAQNPGLLFDDFLADLSFSVSSHAACAPVRFFLIFHEVHGDVLGKSAWFPFPVDAFPSFSQ